MQEEVFHEVADEFITLANRLSDDRATPLLSAAFMYAAARYNVFHALDNAVDDESKQRALHYLDGQFHKMLVENIQEPARPGRSKSDPIPRIKTSLDWSAYKDADISRQAAKAGKASAIIANGFSCRQQVSAGDGFRVHHVARLPRDSLIEF